MSSALNCPDGGTCHHDCKARCWRVTACAPLSITGWEDWPPEVKALHSTKMSEGVARVLLELERQKVEQTTDALERCHEVIQVLAEQYGQMLAFVEGFGPLLEALDAEVTADVRESVRKIIAEGRGWLLNVKRLDTSLPEMLRAVRDD
jgi:hypothetical protein